MSSKIILETRKQKLETDEEAKNEERTSFFRKLIKESIENEMEIDSLLRNILEKWDLNRVALLDKIIAHLGVCEIKFFSEIPKPVSINEYIEIAKEYGSEQSGKFINGVLNAVTC